MVKRGSVFHLCPAQCHLTYRRQVSLDREMVEDVYKMPATHWSILNYSMNRIEHVSAVQLHQTCSALTLDPKFLIIKPRVERNQVESGASCLNTIVG